MQNEATQSATMVKNLDMTANPAPLGLVGFGMTTVLLNLHNAGFFALGSMILAMGIFYGGLAQIIAGIEEWKKNNTFGATAFTSYGLFWLTLVALLVLPKMGLAEAPDKTAMAAYLAMWGIFTAVMFIGTLKTNRALQTGVRDAYDPVLPARHRRGNRKRDHHHYRGIRGDHLRVPCDLRRSCTGLKRDVQKDRSSPWVNSVTFSFLMPRRPDAHGLNDTRYDDR